MSNDLISSYDIVVGMADMFSDILEIDCADIEELSPGNLEVTADGGTFRIMSAELYEQHCEDVMDNLTEMYEDEVNSAIDANIDYLACYVKFDAEMFKRDAYMDVELQVATYDGCVYEEKINDTFYYGWRED